MKFEVFKKNILTVIFCLFIAVFSVLLFFLPKKDFAENENRFLQRRPDFTIETLLDGSLGKKFETFLSDQFPARNFFVSLNSYYNLYTGRTEINGVYIGDDGYIITKPVEYTEDLLNKNINYFNKFSEKIDANVYMTVVPTTGYIMNDKLPPLHEEYNDNEILQTIKENLSSSINFVDITDAFSNAKNETQLYYKTDHHWTTPGAYLAYQLFCDASSNTPADKSSFTIETHDDFFGTTYAKSALWLKDDDIIEFWKNEFNDNVDMTIEDGEKSYTSSSMFFYDKLQNNDKYPVFLDGNHSYITIKGKSESGKKLLMVRDSYGSAISSFLINNYSEIILVDLRYYKYPVSKVVEENNIDDVYIVYGMKTFANDSNIVFLN